MVKTIFGTCGIRRKFSQDFSGPQWLEIGMAIGTYLGKHGTVLIGRDTRQTAELVQYALISGLVSCGCEVNVLQGSAESPYVTTSTIAYCAKHFKADCGIQVTASHNTPEYIGIKLWQGSTGMGFTPAQEEAIDEIVQKKSFRLARWDEIPKVRTILNANDIHLKGILQLVKAPLEFKEGPVTAVIDPGNGAACEIAPRLLQKLGVNVVTINAQPDGLFPGRHSEPTEENISTLIKMIRNDDDLHIGIAFDGDADRVRFVDGAGTLIEGDRVLLLYVLHLDGDGDRGRSPSVVTPVNSSMVLEDTLEELGIGVSRTRIGDIAVAMRMQETNARLGGELSGTYTWPEFHYGPDALLSMAKLLEIVAAKGSLETLMRGIPRYHVLHDEIEVDDRSFAGLDVESFRPVLDSFFEKEGMKITGTSHVDGILFRFDGGFFLARLSGTTPLVRLTCEHGDGARAKAILEGTREAIAEKMGHP